MTRSLHPRLRLVVDNGPSRLVCDLPDTDAFVTWGSSERGWSRSTCRSYAYRVEAADRWLRTHRDTALDLASTADLRAWLAAVATASANTRAQYRGAIRAYFAWLGRDAGEAYHDPSDGLASVRRRSKLPKALTSTQAAAVVRAARTQPAGTTVLVGLLLRAGLRNAEARQLTWDHVSDGHLRILGKGAKERVVPAHTQLRDELESWRRVGPASPYVVCSPRDTDQPLSPDAVRYRIRRVGEDAGVDGLHPHQLRHTFATELVQAGVPIHEIQELMGHASLATTEKYLRVRPERLAAAVNAVTY